MNRRTFIISAITVVVLALGGFGLYSWLSGPGQEPTKVTLMIGFTPNVGYAPYYVAKAKGFYQEEGLDVEFQYTAEGVGAVMKQLGAGKVEFGYGGDSGIIDAAAQNVPVMAVQKIIQKNLFRIVVRLDSGINTPADLRGKSIAFSGPTGGDTQVAKIILYESGLRFDEIEARFVGAQTIAAFVEGQVDALGAYLPQQVIAEALMKEKAKAFEGHRYTPLGTTYTYTSKRLAEKNPGLVERFVRATQKGLDYAVKNPEEAVDAFILYNPDAADKRALHLSLWEAFADHGFDWDTNGNIIYGLPSEDNWDRKIAQMVAAGVLEEPISLQGYITDQFARPALGR
jgi:ABC-type nitrate/sulfonate/bicarbonate transport system substrate-binding protein